VAELRSTSKRIGIDTGGTFTDLILFDVADGTVSSLKVPSTPGRPLEAFIASIRQSGAAADAIDFLVHGTTVATNALIQRQGATVAFVCTAGHEDIPYIQRVNRQFLYDLDWDKPKPLLRSRRHCFGVKERIDAHGEVVLPLDDGVIDEVCDLIGAGEFEAIAVCLLFSYLNTTHEEQLAAALRERFPDTPLTVSHEVAPIWREYERSSTTIADAYVKPLMQRYVSSLQGGLEDAGLDLNWALMKSNGGLMDAKSAADHPIHLAMSGPAGGAVASKYVADLLQLDDVVTLDVGGTSADVGLILGSTVGYTTSYEIEWGIPAAIPLIDIHTVGAGGGSIAWVNAGGFLQVGPRSAGADPGPICYGAGGREVTITDANLTLGRLDPDYFLDGTMRLDDAMVQSAMEQLAGTLDMTVLDLAVAVIEIANENMANAIRMVSIERGHDPRQFALLAFGGAGPLHGAAIARKLGIPRMVVPPFPGSFSALGLLLGDLRVDKVWTQGYRSDRVTAAEVVGKFDTIAAAAVNELRMQGFDGEPSLEYAINMRYLGQNYETEVEVPRLSLDMVDTTPEEQLERAYAAFNDAHRSMYDYVIKGALIEMTSFRVTAIGAIPHPQLARVGAVERDRARSRDVFFAGHGRVPTTLVRRPRMPVDEVIAGPAIIEEAGSTTVVEPGMTVRRTDQDILIVEVN
jgi:N-methylhydantoinase A